MCPFKLTNPTLLPCPTDQRGVKCIGCSEKADFVKKCEESEHLDL